MRTLLADLVIVDRDPFTEVPQAPRDVQVLRTAVGGETVSAQAGSPSPVS